MNCPPLVSAVSAGRHSRSDGPPCQVRLYAPREDVAGMVWVIAIRPHSVAAFNCRCAHGPTAQLAVTSVSSLSH